jgi:hypothetical protein
MKSLDPLAAAALAAVLAAGSGCGRDDVAHYRVPKVPAVLASPAQAMPAPVPGPPGSAMPPPELPAGSSRPAWSLPPRWTQEAGGSAMRYATLKAPVAGKVDVSVTVLPGDAGGELANVNRWRNQIGLPPLDGAGLAAARKQVRTGAGAISLYDFASADRRLIAGLALVDGNSWFVKMTGEAAAVGQARGDFLRLVESLRREASH